MLYWKKVFRHLRFHYKWGKRRPQRADSSANFLSEFQHFWLPSGSFLCNSIISQFPFSFFTLVVLQQNSGTFTFFLPILSQLHPPSPPAHMNCWAFPLLPWKDRQAPCYNILAQQSQFSLCNVPMGLPTLNSAAQPVLVSSTYIPTISFSSSSPHFLSKATSNTTFLWLQFLLPGIKSKVSSTVPRSSTAPEI